MFVKTFFKDYLKFKNKLSKMSFGTIINLNFNCQPTKIFYCKNCTLKNYDTIQINILLEQ